MDNSPFNATHFSFFRKGILTYVTAMVTELDYTAEVEYDVSPDDSSVVVFVGSRGIIADMDLDEEDNVIHCDLTRIKMTMDLDGSVAWTPPPEDKHRPREGLLKTLRSDIIWMILGETAEA